MSDEFNRLNDDYEDDIFYPPQDVVENSVENDHFDSGEYATNPADSDGLEEDFESVEQSQPESEESPEKLEEIEAAEKAHAEKTRNKAPFLNRFRILMVIFASLFTIIILSVFIIPAFKKDEKQEDLLDKRGQVYIPDKITKWSPDEALVNSSPFENNIPEKKAHEEKSISADEVDDLLAEIPFSDEAELQNEQNTAPVPVQGTGGGGTVSTRPVTNRNPQQKAISRMPLNNNDNGFAGAVGNAITGYGGNYGNNSLSYSSESYGQYAQDRMNTLLGQTHSMTNSGNSYQQQNMQSNKQQFQSAGAGNYSMQWNTEYDLNYGTIIPATLITGINTDLPGIVIAQVTSNVYSSIEGQHLLIPAGTRIYATYNSSVSYGQNRVQVAWNKMIRPDGLEIDLGNFTGVDSQGYAGYKGYVNNHPFETLKALGLIAAFSILDTKMEKIQGAQNNMYTQNVLADTYAEINKMGAKIIDRALDIQPTISIPQGREVKIITNVTMSLPPVAFNPQVEKYVRQ